MTDDTTALARLRCQVRRTLPLAPVLAAAPLAILPALRRPWLAVVFLTATGLCLALILGRLWALLPEHRHQPGAALLPRLGPGTWLSLLRGLFLAWLAGLLFLPWSSLLAMAPLSALMPGLCYGLASLLDLLDGYLARRTGTATRLGAALDVELDALGLALASSMGVRLGRLPAAYLAVGAAFYVYRGAIWWRARHGRPVFPPPFRVGARHAAGFQMGLVALGLLPVLPFAAV
ncbi:MAG: CDP-alcohol phosphatidyltransferase family protein, partial [Thermodesulfobacteriota bacterium]